MSSHEELCISLRDRFQGVLSWKWDSRFNAILTEFKLEMKDQVRQVLDSHLSYIWDNSMLKKSPESVQAVGNLIGGLMSNQLLFTSNPDLYPLSFGAWWPWGDGSTISIRISITDPSLDGAQSAKLINQSKALFGL